jgi:septal ring factor EnvC (AmiA/AmiB activator)|tara:strand:+ start:54 stop:452 length:399 start_codon:yes stop_codon:yes gene_type:complete
MTITKNKNKETIYTINKRDSLITFKGHNYDINDNATARNLIYMLMDKCIQDDDLIDNYKTIVENIEKNHNECRKTNVKLRDTNKRLEKELKESDKLLSISIDEKKIIEKDNNKIKNSIEMFFRLNENIIKEF